MHARYRNIVEEEEGGSQRKSREIYGDLKLLKKKQVVWFKKSSKRCFKGGKRMI